MRSKTRPLAFSPPLAKISRCMSKRKSKTEKANIQSNLKTKIKKHRKEVADIISGKSNRFLLVIGPCSAWPEKATFEYAKRLTALQEKVKDKIKIVIRVYTQKPRTNLGWKGLALQKDPCKNPNIKASVAAAQKLMQKISELDLAIADEALFLPITHYYEDFLSYVALGARSSEDQEHRSYGATLDFAVGVKNPSSGDLEVAANSVLATRSENIFYLEGEYRLSAGNSYAHLVLRGGKKPNYFEKDLLQAKALLLERGVGNPAAIVDCNHANSGKDHLKQIKIVKYIIKKKKENKEIGDFVRGLMIESFLKDGNQKISCDSKMDLDGLSITDPSLGWGKSEELVKWIYENL